MNNFIKNIQIQKIKRNVIITITLLLLILLMLVPVTIAIGFLSAVFIVFIIQPISNIAPDNLYLRSLFMFISGVVSGGIPRFIVQRIFKIYDLRKHSIVLMILLTIPTLLPNSDLVSIDAFLHIIWIAGIWFGINKNI